MFLLDITETDKDPDKPKCVGGKLTIGSEQFDDLDEIMAR